MVIPHLVRLGPFGHVGRFLPIEPTQFPRGSRVICRTRRGLEIGQVLTAEQVPAADLTRERAVASSFSDSTDSVAPIGFPAPPGSTDALTSQISEKTGHAKIAPATDGELLRKVTVEDDLVLARIEQRKHDAFDACSRLLAERGVPAALMEVEHLFDGQSLYFYFLGPPPAEAEAITAELATAYDAAVEFQKFADAVEAGCGPHCGTDQAAGCGTGSGSSGGGCASCAIASACAKH